MFLHCVCFLQTAIPSVLALPSRLSSSPSMCFSLLGLGNRLPQAHLQGNHSKLKVWEAGMEQQDPLGSWIFFPIQGDCKRTWPLQEWGGALSIRHELSKQQAPVWKEGYGESHGKLHFIALMAVRTNGVYTRTLAVRKQSLNRN